MKKIVLITGLLLLIFNTLAGLIISAYSLPNFLATNLSIALTTALMLWIAQDKYSDAIRIGLTSLFALTGLVRMICVIVMSQTWENNYLVLVAFGILLFEVVCLAAAAFIDKK
ncbi:MAG: hypothetical protein FWC39_06395 [Bacteroidetes bacterium]|nr:hypothetical protein [Bacteroidota bacterium]